MNKNEAAPQAETEAFFALPPPLTYRPGGWQIAWLIAYKPYEAVARLVLWFVQRLPKSCWPKTRYLRSESSRIGHLAAEPDIFLKELQLGLRPAGKYVWVIRPGKVCNQCLLNYWRHHLKIYDRGLGRFFLLPVARQRWLGVELNEPMVANNKTSAYAPVMAKWGNRPPLLHLHPEHRRQGEAAMAKLGLPPGAWFVGVHNREPGYLPPGKYGDNYRNADVRTLIPAMEEIVRRGGWCVRMGDPSMTPLPPLPGVIDYAHSPARCDMLDVYLCGANKFFLGCASGLGWVASIFGRPVAEANAAPLSMMLYYGPQDLSIAKLYLDAKTGQPWTFAEIFNHPAGNDCKVVNFSELIKLRDSTPEEIVDLVNDMFAQLDGQPFTADDEVRQRRFLSLMKPGHYSYGAPSRVSPSFLRRHEALLG